MKKLSYMAIALVMTFLLMCPCVTFAQELTPVKLLKPQVEGGKALMQVLNQRKSSRRFSNEKLSLQLLSNLLWAACGVNRQGSGKRTAPSAVNLQEIDIYVAMSEGLYLYDAGRHLLTPVLAGDIRAKTGTQAYVKNAAVNLIYVADFSRMERIKSDESRVFYSAADTGFISQNVYLFCASEGLSTVVRGMIDRSDLAKVMGLGPHQKIILAQSVGYPK